MQEEENKKIESSSENNALVVNTSDLNKESLEIINQVIAEQNITKTNDLTQLFNINQKKKTMVRVNKLNDLLDKITDTAIERFTKKPDEIDNTTLIQALKTVQDMTEKSQKMINDQPETPLIQINQQEVNIGTDEKSLSRESRDRVKNAVAGILASLAVQKPKDEDIIDADVITAEVEEEKHD